MIQSPLNYTGGKYKLLPQIFPLFPKDIGCFVDLFCGGCNVGINVSAEKYVFNDISEPLINLLSTMAQMDTNLFKEKVDFYISAFGLSDSKKKGYSFYCCDSSKGLASYNRDKYYNLRLRFNSNVDKNDDYYVMLFVLIIYAFNNQIRFNSSNQFNLPPGKRDFNAKIENKLISFLNQLHSKNIVFRCDDFRAFNIDNLTSSDFVYADPPYLITCASYNEQRGWTEKDETDLLQFLDSLTEKNIRFALSNVLESKSKKNNILCNWIEKRPDYVVHALKFSYSNANYQRQKKNEKTKEVLITNY